MILAIRLSTGQWDSCRSTWSSALAKACLRRASDENCTNSATFGNDLATCSTLTHSERKKRALRRYCRKLGPRTVVLFEDETDLRFFPPLSGTWVLRGKRAKVRISGYNARRVVSCVFNVCSGHRLWLVRDRQRSVEFQELLHVIHHHYRSWKVVLFLDEDSSHTAQASQACAADLGIKLCWLPVRCPELNPLESLWRYLKARRCTNRQYSSIDQQVESVLEELKSMSPLQALSTSGVLSGNFWLFT